MAKFNKQCQYGQFTNKIDRCRSRSITMIGEHSFCEKHGGRSVMDAWKNKKLKTLKLRLTVSKSYTT